MRFTYVVTSGPVVTSISLKKELEAIADFGLLSPHKAKARLELLESGRNEGRIVSDLQSKDFKLIKEEAHVGCGFVPEAMLAHILGDKSDGKCIHVRVVSPQLGIFKGVLCPKRNVDQVELPTSMQKVKPSKVRPAADWVCLIVKNICPTSKNVQIGRELNSDAAPCLSYFRRDNGPGEMIERLWQSQGVPLGTCKQYAKRCNKKGSISGLKHSYLLGVADPTGQLPKGHVFIPGMGKDHGRHTKLFTTRSPCVEPSDGRYQLSIQSQRSCQPQTGGGSMTFLLELLFLGHPEVRQYRYRS